MRELKPSRRATNRRTRGQRLRETAFRTQGGQSYGHGDPPSEASVAPSPRFDADGEKQIEELLASVKRLVRDDLREAGSAQDAAAPPPRAPTEVKAPPLLDLYPEEILRERRLQEAAERRRRDIAIGSSADDRDAEAWRADQIREEGGAADAAGIDVDVLADMLIARARGLGRELDGAVEPDAEKSSGHASSDGAGHLSNQGDERLGDESGALGPEGWDELSELMRKADLFLGDELGFDDELDAEITSVGDASAFEPELIVPPIEDVQPPIYTRAAPEAELDAPIDNAQETPTKPETPPEVGPAAATPAPTPPGGALDLSALMSQAKIKVDFGDPSPEQSDAPEEVEEPRESESLEPQSAEHASVPAEAVAVSEPSAEATEPELVDDADDDSAETGEVDRLDAPADLDWQTAAGVVDAMGDEPMKASVLVSAPNEDTTSVEPISADRADPSASDGSDAIKVSDLDAETATAIAIAEPSPIEDAVEVGEPVAVAASVPEQAPDGEDASSDGGEPVVEGAEAPPVDEIAVAPKEEPADGPAAAESAAGRYDQQRPPVDEIFSLPATLAQKDALAAVGALVRKRVERFEAEGLQPGKLETPPMPEIIEKVGEYRPLGRAVAAAPTAEADLSPRERARQALMGGLDEGYTPAPVAEDETLNPAPQSEATPSQADKTREALAAWLEKNLGRVVEEMVRDQVSDGTDEANNAQAAGSPPKEDAEKE